MYAHKQDAFDRSKLVESAIRKRANDGTLLDLKTLPFFHPIECQGGTYRGQIMIFKLASPNAARAKLDGGETETNPLQVTSQRQERLHIRN